MVSEKKKRIVEEIAKEMKNYKVIGIVNMFKLPARQLQDIKRKMKGKAKIVMVKKRLITRAIDKSGKKGLKKLIDYIEGQPALIFANTNPFEIAKIIDSAKSPAFAKPGDIAPKDIVIKAGPTPLKAGPVIGELQRAKLPVSVEGENIVIREDTLFVKEGEEIDKTKADILGKLGIEPMEIKLSLVAAYEDGIVYTSDILFVPKEKYVEDLMNAHAAAFNLALNINYITTYTLPLLLSKAYNAALSLALNAAIPTKEVLPQLMAKANAHMMALKAIIAKEK
ncbi:MAG: 50S ribosomal protein L10 [Candidatus Aenigmatarchaeota archaeon]|nr:MAG: 50S ribosomal protein L10 [Candidatus Aenigmarchaeota archaeon]